MISLASWVWKECAESGVPFMSHHTGAEWWWVHRLESCDETCDVKALVT